METHALALVHDNNNHAKHHQQQQQQQTLLPPPAIVSASAAAAIAIPPTVAQIRRLFPVISIATISSGFEKGDFLVREEKGQRV